MGDGGRWHQRKGFRVNRRRIGVMYRLRMRMMYLVRLLTPYGWRALQSLKKSISINRRRSAGLVMEEEGSIGTTRLRSYGRSNSFYSEAIADCLEFIKRSSVSVSGDDISVARRHDPINVGSDPADTSDLGLVVSPAALVLVVFHHLKNIHWEGRRDVVEYFDPKEIFLRSGLAREFVACFRRREFFGIGLVEVGIYLCPDSLDCTEESLSNAVVILGRKQ
ncbi:hypothetical protein HHK36_010512 [Tetracentron sinense]|uniref:Uncharacterized protein n=1 Tax=Tetracentron sinense TaxID=13715 RepID=A0A834ZEC9_TETSI|nr:hypothetical protein HHK36_010512 [Tetracentron sinense]